MRIILLRMILYLIFYCIHFNSLPVFLPDLPIAIAVGWAVPTLRLINDPDCLTRKNSGLIYRNDPYIYIALHIAYPPLTTYCIHVRRIIQSNTAPLHSFYALQKSYKS